ncbi:MAG: Glycerophosphoryl diester phosphodiesterase [uncultured Rubrobacteraceae bacterium]|uniref:Glycerophosphoryl diester phosphodiesterase n=1 Tax=uncultured Rubrobacteraceae bacterium TaxID=349277 RepID=A0A6J4RAC6_9ACTN|nr:MAG: Glycerophosphoryl diester phosphodiesterase [uncultured Rubrobacteraceae bacterium]
MSGKWTHIALVTGFVALVVAVLRSRPKRRGDGRWPVNFAHRGASSRAPENTLEAFHLAAESGAGGLELDVHMTSDGHVVVIHDDSVGRTTDGSGLVRDMTLREVRRLDAGYHFTPDGGETYPYRGRGVRVPELGEVLRGFPNHKVNVDIKEEQTGIEAAVLEVIVGAGAGDRVLVVSEMLEVLERFRKLSEGGVSTGASRREIGAFYRLSRMRLESLSCPFYNALQVPVESGGRRIVTRRFIEAAHNRGVRVDVWTIDEPEEMRRLLDLGADVIMTNRPEVVDRVLRGRW